MARPIEIKEFYLITCNNKYANKDGYGYLEPEAFQELESLILTYENENESAGDFFSLSSKKHVGKVIRAKNYVGMVQMKNGTQIQILPKINKLDEEDTKRTFLRMLKSMKDFPSKSFSEAHLKTDQMNLYEIFIRLYIQEVDGLVKQGIKSAYHPVERNSFFYKGKLLVNEHIKQNAIHKERFFIEYDEFSIDRAENRLIKSTLLKLLKISTSAKNVKEIRRLLTFFDPIGPSHHVEKDFAKVVIDRSTKSYDQIMKWSNVFLLNKSFTTFSGDSSARALLFPMEKVFESYVSKNLKKMLAGTDWTVSLQNKKYYLFEKQFALKPDIVLESAGRVIILDTKWKALQNNSRKNYGIAQSDMYQMYAYAKKYKTNEIWLLYPTNTETIDMKDIQFKSDDNVLVRVFFIDLSDIEDSLKELIHLFETNSV